MRKHHRHRSWIVLLCINFLFVSCGNPELRTRTQREDVPPGPSEEEIKRCTTDPLKNCQPAPPELAAKIADPDNLTAEDLRLLDEAGAVTDGQLKKAVEGLDQAAAAFKADIEAVQKQLGADVTISNKYHAHIDLYAGVSAPAAVPYDNVKAHGLPMSWIEAYYAKNPPMVPDFATEKFRRATPAEVAQMLKHLAEHPDPFGMSYTKEELDALVARTEKLRGEDSKDSFLGSLAFKFDDVYVVVYGKTDIVIYAKDKDIQRAANNAWVPKLPNNIYRAYYQGKVGTDPGKTLDQRIDQSVERTLKNYRDMKEGERAAIKYLIFSVVPVLATATELDKKLCGQPGSSWLKVGGSFFLDVGFVFTFVPGRLAFGVMLGADGVAVGLLYLDGDPKNMTVIKWQGGFVALALLFRGGPMLRAGMNILGKVPVVTTAVRSYNALLAAFKVVSGLMKKKCYIFPKKPKLVAAATTDEPEYPGDPVPVPVPVPDEDVTMDDVETAIDADFIDSIFQQSQDTLENKCDCMCDDEPTEDPDEVADHILCGGGEPEPEPGSEYGALEDECCYPEDAACQASPFQEPIVTPFLE